ncbi:hypothetical protein VOI45_00950, partial [Acidaminococcus fermentans]
DLVCIIDGMVCLTSLKDVRKVDESCTSIRFLCLIFLVLCPIFVDKCSIPATADNAQVSESAGFAHSFWRVQQSVPPWQRSESVQHRLAP